MNPVVVSEITRVVRGYGGLILIILASAAGGALLFFLGEVVAKIRITRNFQNYLSTHHRTEKERVTKENAVLSAKLDENRRVLDPVVTALRVNIHSAEAASHALLKAYPRGESE